MLAYGKIARKVPTLTAGLKLEDDIRHQPRHQLPEVRHIFRGQSQHQLDFKFGILAGVGVVKTPTPGFRTELEITHCVDFFLTVVAQN